MTEVSGGRLRLRCDADDCPKFFTPKRPLPADPFKALQEIRVRAWGNGWQVSDPLAGSDADHCPEHKS